MSLINKKKLKILFPDIFMTKNGMEICAYLTDV